jgi:hypothetical protein
LYNLNYTPTTWRGTKLKTNYIREQQTLNTTAVVDDVYIVRSTSISSVELPADVATVASICGERHRLDVKRSGHGGRYAVVRVNCDAYANKFRLAYITESIAQYAQVLTHHLQ